MTLALPPVHAPDVRRGLERAKSLAGSTPTKDDNSWWGPHRIRAYARAIQELDQDIDRMEALWPELQPKEKAALVESAYEILDVLDDRPPVGRSVDRKAQRGLRWHLSAVLFAPILMRVNQQAERVFWRYCDAIFSKAEGDSESLRQLLAQRLEQIRGASEQPAAQSTPGEIREHVRRALED